MPVHISGGRWASSMVLAAIDHGPRCSMVLAAIDLDPFVADVIRLFADVDRLHTDR